MKKILITGGTGLIGQFLTRELLTRGYEVGILTRQPVENSDLRHFGWNPRNSELDQEAIHWCDAIIHLAGASIAESRWTEKRKQVILDSRVLAGDLLYRALKKTEKKLERFISASAIGYYGAQSGEQIYSESDPPGNDFQGKVCQAWEQASIMIAELGIPTTTLRIGIVLSTEGGAVPKMALPVRWGFGAPLGTGRQYLPWIHIQDLARLFIYLLESKEQQGVFNAVASAGISNRDFTRQLARVLKRPLILPAVPGFILKLFLGQMSEIVLEGSRVDNKKLRESGFSLKYHNLEHALQDLFHPDPGRG